MRIQSGFVAVSKQAVLLLVFMLPAIALAQENQLGQDQSDHLDVHFKMVRGGDLPVCKAYLQQINQTRYETYPECDMPQAPVVPGMSSLTRVGVLSSEIETVDGDIAGYLSLGTPAAARGKTHLPPNYQTKSYRFEPRVDIENNGHPDNVLMWNSDNRSSPTCGDIPSNGSPFLTLFGANGIILSDDGKHIDTDKTKSIFGNHRGGVQLGPDAGNRFISRFAPVGYSYNVFEYRSVVYYSAFLAQYFDYHRLPPDDPSSDVLAVFVHKDKSTRLMCEYVLHR